MRLGKLLIAFLLIASSQAFGAYSFYRSITVDYTKTGSSDLSNFPVLVSISHATLKTLANGGHVQNTTTQSSPGVTMPADLIFATTSAGSTKLPWEVESYDAVNGILVAWVQLPTVSHSTNTTFYMLYGDATITTAQNTGSYSPANVWDSSFGGVWHLSNPTNPINSTGLTSSANHGSSAVTGKVAGGAGFASGNYVDLGYTGSLSVFTYSAWIYVTGASYETIIGGQYAGGMPQWRVDAGRTLSLLDQNVVLIGTSSVTISNSIWTYVAVTYNAAGDYAFYVNGVLRGSGTHLVSFGGLGSNTWLGWCGNSGGEDYIGDIDEFRISNSATARSADWILTEYNNQNAPGNIGTDSFLKFGGETVPGAAGTIRHRVIGGE
jgi:hypothetical protein